LVTGPDGLAEVISAIEASGGTVGLDTETTGLSHVRDRVRLLSLATAEGTFLIDLFRVDPAPLWPVLGAVTVVGHHLGFDIPFLMRLGFVPGRLADTMLASQLLHAGDGTIRHSLQELTQRHLGVTLDKGMQTSDWSAPLTPEMVDYAALDARIPLRLWENLATEADAVKLSGVLALEMSALPCIAWAALHGVGFDRSRWEPLVHEAALHRDTLRSRLDSLAAGPVNWNSPEQIKTVFRGLGITLDSTKDDALAGVDHPLAGALREYRSAAKLVSSYGSKWLSFVAGDDRVYATWKQLGAASGRMSCKKPNLQQLPRDPSYRRCFVAPEGRVLVRADYSQIELRIAARIANDRQMLDAYRKGEDLHTLTARAVLGKTDVAKEDRQLAKSLNFGLLYGMGAKALAAYAAANFGVTLSGAEATKHREAFFRAYPGLRRWHSTVSNGTHQTRTLAGRRRIGVTAFTEMLNTPVQGTGADGLKRALALLWERRGDCPGAFPVLLVHDEIVVECDEDKQNEVVVWVREAMRDGMAPLLDPVPVEVEVSAGRTWAG
jgi:DNA polymerase-1